MKVEVKMEVKEMKQQSKLKIFSLEIINMDTEVRKKILLEFNEQYNKTPELAFYALCYENGRPTILVSKKMFNTLNNANKKLYYAQIIKEKV
jgi:hypothetical protein